MEIKKVCVAGGGLMGRQIALNTAIYDYQVRLFELNAGVRMEVEKWAEEYLTGRIEKGRMSPEQVDGIKSRFKITETLEEAASGADLVIEAIVEREDVKTEFFKQLNTLVRKDTIIATNSSCMPSSMFVDCIDNPERLCNLHYFNPALVMKLTEVVRGEHTGEATIQAMMEFSKNTGKSPILLNREIYGFITNRILGAIYREAHFLVEEGYCSYQDLDTACENGLSHSMGPYRLMDLTGIDLEYDIMRTEYNSTGEKPAGFDIVEKMYSQGRYGRKTGKGFYDYS